WTPGIFEVRTGPSSTHPRSRTSTSRTGPGRAHTGKVVHTGVHAKTESRTQGVAQRVVDLENKRSSPRCRGVPSQGATTSGSTDSAGLARPVGSAVRSLERGRDGHEID